MSKAICIKWVPTLLMLVSSAQSLHAADPPQIRWHADINEAWKESQAKNRPLLVFVTRADCVPCAKMKVGTYADPAVALAVQSRFVALIVDGTRPSPLLKDLAVNAYPATFVISPEAVILERIDGFVPPQQFAGKLAQISTTPRARIQPVSGPAS